MDPHGNYINHPCVGPQQLESWAFLSKQAGPYFFSLFTTKSDFTCVIAHAQLHVPGIVSKKSCGVAYRVPGSNPRTGYCTSRGERWVAGSSPTTVMFFFFLETAISIDLTFPASLWCHLLTKIIKKRFVSPEKIDSPKYAHQDHLQEAGCLSKHHTWILHVIPPRWTIPQTLLIKEK